MRVWRQGIHHTGEAEEVLADEEHFQKDSCAPGVGHSQPKPEQVRRLQEKSWQKVKRINSLMGWNAMRRDLDNWGRVK